jgi:predicted kinase
MKYQLEDISEIAKKLTDLGMGIEKNLILITALPGVGKTTLAREFVRQTKGIHFDIDDIKRVVVPEDMVTEGIDSPEYRYKYYAGAIRKLPDLFAQSSAQIVIMDETFHLQAFRHMWDEASLKSGLALEKIGKTTS